MKRISRLIALWAAISLLYPIPRIWAGDAAGPPNGAAGPVICFPLPDGERILRDLEALPSCREAVEAAEGAIRTCEGRSNALDARVLEQDRELKDARKLVDDTRKAGEEAAKAAGGPWYSRALSVAKWIGLGVLIGFVGGMGK